MNTITTLKEEVRCELENNILPFWMDKMTDHEKGGFYGQMDGHNQLHKEAPKGAILHARILWTFSAAYRLLGKPEYLQTATHAKQFLLDHLYDHVHGGIYWEVDSVGNPLQTKKQIYALGFALYGLSEFARATGDQEALSYAIKLFHCIEQRSFDKEKNGYLEAFTEEWKPIEDMRLSEKDENEKKTMNTHLHILEPYTNLYRIWKDEGLRLQIVNLIELFIGPMLNAENGHLQLFFNENWQVHTDIYSYGHDIEASWLIHEAALIVDDKSLLTRVEEKIRFIAKAAEAGLMANGGLIYEYFPQQKRAETEFHWWVQAENVVGHINLYQHFEEASALQIALNGWSFIKKELIDHKQGEWYWGVYLDGTINQQEDKAGFWKCPYHNGRMCLEIMERFS